MPRLHPRVLDVGGAFSVFSGPYVEGIQEVPEGFWRAGERHEGELEETVKWYVRL